MKEIKKKKKHAHKPNDAHHIQFWSKKNREKKREQRKHALIQLHRT